MFPAQPDSDSEQHDQVYQNTHVRPRNRNDMADADSGKFIIQLIIDTFLISQNESLC